MILIGLGANLPSEYGTPAETLEVAKQALNEQGVAIVKSSRTYLSAPVPVSDAPWYANAVVQINTKLDPEQLLAALNRIEADFGRVRTYRNAPRILDLDILAYNDEILGKDGDYLCVPHPRMHERTFVVKPLYEITSDWEHPILKQTCADLMEELKENQPQVVEETVPLQEGEEYRVAG